MGRDLYLLKRCQKLCLTGELTEQRAVVSNVHLSSKTVTPTNRPSGRGGADRQECKK